jgi:RsiW-degrading membrane proteinase PrsW (M82 family)
MGIKLIALILIALAPCLFWLWVIYKRDKYAPEPLFLVVRIFFFGMLVAIPVAAIEAFLYPSTPQNNMSLSTAFYLAFVVAGVTEEAGKFLVVRTGIYRSPHFEEPADGLVYAAAAALGFAALENIVYLLSFGWQVILLRGLFSNLAHVLFSSFWGYPLALNKLGMLKNKNWVAGGLLAAMVAHGIFDFLFFTNTVYTFLVIPFFVGMLVIYALMFRHANQHSVYIPHRSRIRT